MAYKWHRLIKKMAALELPNNAVHSFLETFDATFWVSHVLESPTPNGRGCSPQDRDPCQRDFPSIFILYTQDVAKNASHDASVSHN